MPNYKQRKPGDRAALHFHEVTLKKGRKYRVVLCLDLDKPRVRIEQAFARELSGIRERNIEIWKNALLIREVERLRQSKLRRSRTPAGIAKALGISVPKAERIIYKVLPKRSARGPLTFTEWKATRRPRPAE